MFHFSLQMLLSLFPSAILLHQTKQSLANFADEYISTTNIITSKFQISSGVTIQVRRRDNHSYFSCHDSPSHDFLHPILFLPAVTILFTLQTL